MHDMMYVMRSELKEYQGGWRGGWVVAARSLRVRLSSQRADQVGSPEDRQTWQTLIKSQWILLDFVPPELKGVGAVSALSKIKLHKLYDDLTSTVVSY